MRPSYQVTELLGDGIGPELSRAIHHLAAALPIDLEFLPVDFSLESRRSRGKAIYDEAIEKITATRVALKHPTTTAEESPNAILRRRLDLSVIHRPVYTIPGVPTNFRRELDVDIVRIATGGTYDDPGRMIGRDGAVSLRIVERGPVREAARYAFNLARKTGKKVTSSSKYTIQKATDGLFEQVTQEVAGQFPEVPHSVELFDALLGKIIMAPEKFQIVLVLNEYGDFLSDMACGLAGSLGIGASANLGFDAAAVVRVALFDAAHGTAPDIAGKNVANPTAIFLALSLLLYQLGEIAIGQAVKNATLDLLAPGGAHRRPGRNRIDRKLHRGRRRAGRRAAGTAEERSSVNLEPSRLNVAREAPGSHRHGKVATAAMRSRPRFSFSIGSPDGLDRALRRRAGSLSAGLAASSCMIPPITMGIVSLNLAILYALRWLPQAMAGRIDGILCGGMIALFLLVGYYLSSRAAPVAARLGWQSGFRTGSADPGGSAADPSSPQASLLPAGSTPGPSRRNRAAGSLRACAHLGRRLGRRPRAPGPCAGSRSRREAPSPLDDRAVTPL